MLWVDMLMRSYVVIEPFYVFADVTANFIIYFDNYFIVTDVIVTWPNVFKAHFIYYVIMVHDVMGPYGCQGHLCPVVKGCYLSFASISNCMLLK